MLTALDLSHGTGGNVFCLRGAAIDFIPNLFAAAVPQYGILPLFSAKVSAVIINGFLLAVEQIRHQRYIMDVCGGNLQGTMSFSLDT